MDPSVMATPKTRAHVVIVGGGFGGIAAAKALARSPADVTVVDKQNHHCFQPLLYRSRRRRCRPQILPGRSVRSCAGSAMRMC
jgi:NADH dehydrogenase